MSDLQRDIEAVEYLVLDFGGIEIIVARQRLKPRLNPDRERVARGIKSALPETWHLSNAQLAAVTDAAIAAMGGAMNTKWYEFRQNNSGGSFDIDEDAGIGVLVCIEATSAEHANKRAEEIGLYFNGVDAGSDCECCGDRWYAKCWDDASDFPSEYGHQLVRAERQAPEGFVTHRFAHPLDGPFFIVAPEPPKETP